MFTVAVKESVADLLESLGGVPAWRVRLRPTPGTATEADVIEHIRRHGITCELIDGTLVEKPVGYQESRLALLLGGLFNAIVIPRNLGIVTGEQGMMWVNPDRLRGPDVAFVSWGRLPGGTMPQKPYPDLSPDLAVEVLSSSNTDDEMELKRHDYFRGGTRLVWEIDPDERTVSVYTSPVDADQVLGESDTLTAGDVLPGFILPLKEFFAELDRTRDS